MNIEYKDFIGYYRNVYPDGYCQHVINDFESLISSGAGMSRQQSSGHAKHDVDDIQVFLNASNHLTGSSFNGKCMVDTFFSGLQSCFDDYINTFSTLKNIRLRASHMKLQRTGTGGGYHIWHAEQGSSSNNASNRALVYILYLNTLPIGGNGETEFLYQQLRIPPEENMMLIWPAAYTHTHRGNPVYGENYKYIATGWFFIE